MGIFNILKLAAGLSVTIAAATLVIFLSRTSSTMHKQEVSSVQQMVIHSDQSELTRYDGAVMLGDEVRYIIMKHSDSFIRVVSVKHPEGFTEFEDMKNPDSAVWINSTSRFTGKALYEESGTCVGIEFCEEDALINSMITADVLQRLQQYKDNLEKEVS